jgi:L-threonylcarbamoyladenylate synthase
MIDPTHIAQAVALLKSGELVAFPTETVYGLGADASQLAAIEKVYALKKRPSSHPLIVHVASPEQIADWVRDIPSPARALMQSKLMPGPLTLVLPKADHVLGAVSGGQNTVAIRCPDHPVAQALLQAFGGGVVAPSANLFGQISPSHHDHVLQAFGNAVFVLAAGATSVGIESTIVDATQADRLTILRHGLLTAEQLGAIAGVPVYERQNQNSSATPRVSGDLLAHYAPKTRLRLMSTDQLKTAFKNNSKPARLLIWYFGSTHADNTTSEMIQSITLPTQAQAYAAQLYAQLHQADQQQVDEIWIEIPNELYTQAAWKGVLDRLTKAEYGSGQSNSSA